MQNNWLLTYLKSLFLVFLVFSCSEKEDQSEEYAGSIPIRLMASIGDRTRVFGLQDSIIAAGEKVYVWADQVKGSSATPYPSVQGWELVSDGAFHLNPTIPGSRYYPSGNSPINLYALHGNIGAVTSGMPFPSIVTHTVLSDQTIDNNYLLSDLLYVEKLDQKPSQGIHLYFNHLLSKVQVCLQPYGTITESELDNAELYLEYIQPTVTVNLATQQGVTSGVPTSIKLTAEHIPNGASFDAPGVRYGEAIVPPQRIKGIFMKLILSKPNDEKKDTFYYVNEYDRPIDLEMGKTYRFNMNVKHLIKFGGLDTGTWGTDSGGWHIDQPMTVVPYVDDWNHESDYIRWNWMVLSPYVNDWSTDTNGGFWWSWMILPPDVYDWSDYENDRIHWCWMILTPAGVTNWTNDSDANRRWSWLFVDPDVYDWSDYENGRIEFDANNVVNDQILGDFK